MDSDDAGASPAASASFTVLHEHSLSQDVMMGSWCPTMDLLALLMDDGQLVLYRLEWQRLWLACPDVPVTAMCWRPDGEAPHLARPVTCGFAFASMRPQHPGGGGGEEEAAQGGARSGP